MISAMDPELVPQSTTATSIMEQKPTRQELWFRMEHSRRMAQLLDHRRRRWLELLAAAAPILFNPHTMEPPQHPAAPTEPEWVTENRRLSKAYWRLWREARRALKDMDRPK